MSRDEEIIDGVTGSKGTVAAIIGESGEGQPSGLPAAEPPYPVSRQTARTWARIDLEHLRENLRGLRRVAGEDGAVQAVVKADGYGHGAIPIAMTCAEDDIRHFAVATLDEARELRSVLPAGVVDVYLLSPFLPEEAEWVVRMDVIPMLSSREQWVSLVEAAQDFPLPARCFLMVDTGMGREGLNREDADWCIAASGDSGTLRITGIATHFACADEPEADAFTREQVDTLLAMIEGWGVDRLRQWDDGRGDSGLWISLWNSPGILRQTILPRLPNLGRGFLFRAGSVLYGVEPYPDAFADIPELRPILSWFARVTLVKDLPAGATVGYGRTCVLHRPSRIATMAVGYADGLSRRLSNRGTVLLHGQRFPIVGRVSMDQCQVDVTDCRRPVRTGDIVTLVGDDGQERQTILDLAALIGTTPHEPTCALSARVYRAYE